MARLLEQPAEEVLARIGRAERRLAQWLGVPDVRAVLAQFAAGLDSRLDGRRWRSCAMDYLAACAYRCSRRARRGDRNARVSTMHAVHTARAGAPAGTGTENADRVAEKRKVTGDKRKERQSRKSEEGHV